MIALLLRIRGVSGVILIMQVKVGGYQQSIHPEATNFLKQIIKDPI